MGFRILNGEVKRYFKENDIVIYVPDDITSIYRNAFYDCINISRAEISNSVIKIELQAFFNCNKEVISIEKHVFSGCNKLTVYAEEYARKNNICVNTL